VLEKESEGLVAWDDGIESAIMVLMEVLNPLAVMRSNLCRGDWTLKPAL